MLSYQSISEVFRGFVGLDERPEYIAMLWCYLDDSSDPKRERFCAAGGLFTTDKNWKQFEVAWRYATRQLKKPFHATDCECGHEEFRAWEKSDRDALFAELCGLI